MKKNNPKPIVPGKTSAAPPMATPSLATYNADQRYETTRWLVAIIATITTCIAACIAVSKLYHPDIDALKNEGLQMFIDASLIRPEPVESMMFKVVILLLVPCLMLFYSFAGTVRIARALSSAIPFRALIWGMNGFLLWLLYTGMTAINPFGPLSNDRPQNRRDSFASTNFEFYFDWLLTGYHPLAYLMLVVPLTAAIFFWGFRKREWHKSKTFNRGVNILGYGSVLFVLVAIVAMNTINYPYTDENKYDFAAVYYAMTQVYAGSAMLVDHFTDTYGLYPHFLNPVFRIVGLSITKFSLVMSLLLAGSFALNFWLLRKTMKNTVLLFAGFFTVVFFPYLSFKLLTIFDCIFSLYPIRYIIPSVLSCMAWLYFTAPTATRYYVTTIVAAAFVLWNPEIGLACFLGWVAATAYFHSLGSNLKIDIRKIVQYIITGILALVVTFATFAIFIRLFYAAWPDLSLLFSTMSYFGRFGVGTLPMSLIHPWNLSAIVILVGIMYAVSAWYQRKVTPRSALLLFLSLIAVGYFTYFQGRSQNSNFSLSSGFSLMILAILADEWWEKISNYREIALDGLFVIVLICLSFSPIEIAFNANKIIALSNQDEAKEKQKEAQMKMDDNAAFLLKTTTKGEKVLLLTAKKNQPLMFNATRRRSAFNPGFIDLFLQTDRERLEQLVIDSAYKIYFDPKIKLYPFLNNTMNALSGACEYVAHGHYMMMAQKRQTQIPEQTFFEGNNLIFHRKYTNGREGVLMRMADAVGISEFKPDSCFSVSALFHTAPQLITYSCVVGNLKDSSGFIMGTTNMPFTYVFGINATGMTINMPDRRWVYAVMNVTPRYMELYINGNKVTTRPLHTPMRESPTKLSIGNLGDFHNFVGAIAEVAVANGNIDSASVKATMAKMRNAVQH